MKFNYEDIKGEVENISYDEEDNMIVDVIYPDSSKHQLIFINPYPVSCSWCGNDPQI